jgi:hypothetical protein
MSPRPNVVMMVTSASKPKIFMLLFMGFFRLGGPIGPHADDRQRVCRSPTRLYKPAECPISPNI